jgi:hypothetical protein
MSDCSYKPDLLVKLNIKKNVQIDFFCVEIKKPNGNLCNQYETDFVKIHREMKIIIDQQVEFGINDPTAYSLLVEGMIFSSPNSFFLKIKRSFLTIFNVF